MAHADHRCCALRAARPLKGVSHCHSWRGGLRTVCVRAHTSDHAAVYIMCPLVLHCSLITSLARSALLPIAWYAHRLPSRKLLCHSWGTIMHRRAYQLCNVTPRRHSHSCTHAQFTTHPRHEVTGHEVTGHEVTASGMVIGSIGPPPVTRKFGELSLGGGSASPMRSNISFC